MRQLTSLDAQFLAVESARTYGHVGGLAVYDPATAPGGGLEMADICRLVGERIHMLPPFRWRLVGVPLGLDHPYWIEDPDFDLDFHIRDSAVPPPGDDRQLAETVARIFARPLDRTRPLWELYLIHGLQGGRVALLTKVHHSVVDGVSGNEILAVLLDPSPEGREIPPRRGRQAGERVPGELEMLGRGLMGLPMQPLRALRSAPTALPNLTELPGANAFPGVPTFSRGVAEVRRRLGIEHSDPAILEATTARPPRTSFNGRISGHRRFSFGQLSLDTVKAIKNEAGVTVNDVVVSLCAGALRDWLKERDELPARAARRDGAGVRAHRGADGHVRQPRLDDDRADRRPTRPTPSGASSARTSCCAAPRAATRRCPRTCSRTRPASSRPPSPRSPRARRWR